MKTITLHFRHYFDLKDFYTGVPYKIKLNIGLRMQ